MRVNGAIANSAGPMDSMQPTILIVDDEKHTRDGLRSLLENEYDVYVAGDIAGAMNAILADVFALYLKTKNFHWHLSGPHFRDYHLLLDEQGDQLFGMTDPIAERVRKVGGVTIKSIGHMLAPSACAR